MIQKVGRNEPCPCGSGRKFKKCCIARVQPAESQAELSRLPDETLRQHIVAHSTHRDQSVHAIVITGTTAS